MTKVSTTIGDNDLVTAQPLTQEPQEDVFSLIAQWMEENKPKPRTQDIERQQKLAKVHAIGEGLRTLGEGIGLWQGAPVERRNPNPNIFKSLQEANRLKAEDEAKRDAFNRLALDLKLKGLMDKRGQKEKQAAVQREQDRYNTEVNFKIEDKERQKKLDDAKIKQGQDELEETRRYHDLVSGNQKEKNAITRDYNLTKNININSKNESKNFPVRLENGQTDDLTPEEQYAVINLAMNDKSNDDMVLDNMQFDESGKLKMTEGAKWAITKYWSKYKSAIRPNDKPATKEDSLRQLMRGITEEEVNALSPEQNDNLKIAMQSFLNGEIDEEKFIALRKHILSK